MDTIRRLAEQRHFYTAQIALSEYGEALVIGDQALVDHIQELIRRTGEHDLIDITDERNRPA